MVKKGIVLINKKMVTEELLYEKACNLTDISQELQTIADLLEMFDYAAAKKDEFAMSYFINQGKLDNAVSVLQNIQHSISDVSNSICPDLDND